MSEISKGAVVDRVLQRSVVLVTGAGGGIGGEICTTLAAAGAHVVATDVRDRPKSSGAEVWWPLDVTSPEMWARVVAKVGEQFGRLDCLVNNAGVSCVQNVAETSLEQWRRVMSINAESV